MKDEIKIICPSRKRADKIMTKISNMSLFVHEKEFENYKKFNPDIEILTHNKNNLSEIRQEIYDRFNNVFMVDDDISSIERTYLTKDAILTPDDVFNLIQKTYQRAKDLDIHLFGFNNDPSPTHYNQHKPFMFKGYINGCAFGLLEDKNLYFNKKTVACESHWINLLNAFYNRRCFIDKRFHFRQKTNSTFNLDGGQTGKRTLETEKKDTILLKKYFGDSIKLKKAKNKTKQLHQYQRELNIRL